MQDPEMNNMFKRTREFMRNSKLVIITAKARPMTESELEASKKPQIIDYIGMLK